MDAACRGADCAAAWEDVVSADIKAANAGSMRDGIEQRSIQGLGEAPDKSVRSAGETLPCLRRAFFEVDNRLAETGNLLFDCLEHPLT